jgi:hypothetical protein
VSDELPKLFSDEEFIEQRLLRERRELADRRAEEQRAEEKRAEERRAKGERRVLFPHGRRSTDGLPESTIEQKFPHIAKKLTLAWRSEACAAYLSSLTVADRPGRQGFPPEVMEDLMMLHEINEMLKERSRLGPEAASPPAWAEAVHRECEYASRPTA